MANIKARKQGRKNLGVQGPGVSPSLSRVNKQVLARDETGAEPKRGQPGREAKNSTRVLLEDPAVFCKEGQEQICILNKAFQGAMGWRLGLQSQMVAPKPELGGLRRAGVGQGNGWHLEGSGLRENVFKDG